MAASSSSSSSGSGGTTTAIRAQAGPAATTPPAPGSTVCTASNTAGDSNWTGTVSSTGGTLTLTAPAAANIYAYTISCQSTSTTGTITTQAATAYLFDGVPKPVPTDCGVTDNFGRAIPTLDLLAPDASVTTSDGGICAFCSVTQPSNVIDQDPTNYATLNTPVGLLADEALTVTSAANVYPAGYLVGFVASNPGEILTLALLQNVSINTFLDGVAQDTAGATASSPLRLDLLTLLASPKSAFVGFTSTKPFNAIQIADNNLLSVLGQVNVYQACVSTAPVSSIGSSSSSSGGGSSSSSSSSGGSSSSSSSSGGSSSSSGTSTQAASVSVSVSPNPVTPGNAFTLSYVGPGSGSLSTCTAYNTAADPNWSGTVSGAGGSVTLTAPATSNIYTYGITCSLPTGGSSSATASLYDGIPTPIAADCGVKSNLGVPLPTLSLTAKTASVSTAAGGLCIACSVSQPQNVIDQNPTNYAMLNIPVGLLANQSLTVTNATPFTGGHTVGFVADASPGELLTLSLLQGVTVNTLLNGVVQDTSSVNSLISLDLLTLLGNPNASFIGFTTTSTKPFNAIQITDGSLLSVISQVDVYQACVSTP